MPLLQKREPYPIKNNAAAGRMSLNISSIAEPGEARLPSAPPARRVLTSPKPRRSWRDKREAEHRRRPKSAEERSGYALLCAVFI